MARQRNHSTEFKRQVVQEYLADEALYGLAKRHDISRNLILIWIRKSEEGAFDDEMDAATLFMNMRSQSRRLERLVGKQALELEFLKRALKNAPRPRSGITFAITGPTASVLLKGAG